MYLQTRTGLVTQIPLHCRQLHDFTHWPYSRRPRGCQPAMSGSVQPAAAPTSLSAPRELKCSKGHRQACLWQEKNVGDPAEDVLVHVSTLQFMQLGPLWAGSGTCGKFSLCRGSHSLSCVHAHNGCHTLSQSTLMWSKVLLLVTVG